MPTLDELLSDHDRELLLGELDRLQKTASLMRERGTFPAPPAPVPLHGQAEAGR